MHLLKISELNTQYQVFYPFLMEEFFLVEAQDETTLSFFELQYQFRGLVLVYCTQGSLLIKMNKVDYRVEQEAILTILPEMTVEPLSYSEDFRTTVFLMSYDFIEKFTILPEFISNTEVLNSPLLYATAQDQEMIEELMALIVKYYRQPKNILLNQLIQYLVFSLLTGVAKSYQSLTKKENLQKNRINQITDAFFELLQEHGDLQRQVSFYAEQLHLTPQHLNSLIKKRTGKSIKSWIGFVVINKAKEYLTMTSLSIKEISDKMEFADASLFCRYFKRYIGQTPNAYRNQ